MLQGVKKIKRHPELGHPISIKSHFPYLASMQYAGKYHVVPLKKLTRYILRSYFQVSVSISNWCVPVHTYYVYNAMNKYTTQSCNIAHMYIQYSPLPKSSFDQLLMCVTFWLEMVQHVSLYSTQRSIAVLAEAELGQYFKKSYHKHT